MSAPTTYLDRKGLRHRVYVSARPLLSTHFRFAACSIDIRTMEGLEDDDSHVLTCFYCVILEGM